MRNRKAKLSAFVFLPLLLLAGCASQSYVIHPGAANLFDSQAYDVLVVAHTAIEQAKTQLAANQFGAAEGAVKTAVNDLVAAYNAMDAAYDAYHAAAVAGTATPAQVTALQTSMNAVNGAMGNLTVATGGK
jgi:hypothetical protein